jgi:hypothetical protein
VRENREEIEGNPTIPLKHRPAPSQQLNHSRVKEKIKEFVASRKGDMDVHERGTGRPATGHV